MMKPSLLKLHGFVLKTSRLVNYSLISMYLLIYFQDIQFNSFGWQRFELSTSQPEFQVLCTELFLQKLVKFFLASRIFEQIEYVKGPPENHSDTHKYPVKVLVYSLQIRFPSLDQPLTSYIFVQRRKQWKIRYPKTRQNH